MGLHTDRQKTSSRQQLAACIQQGVTNEIIINKTKKLLSATRQPQLTSHRRSDSECSSQLEFSASKNWIGRAEDTFEHTDRPSCPYHMESGSCKYKVSTRPVKDFIIKGQQSSNFKVALHTLNLHVRVGIKFNYSSHCQVNSCVTWDHSFTCYPTGSHHKLQTKLVLNLSTLEG